MSLNTTPTETVIFRNPETGRYGYKVRFVNIEHFHKVWDTCETLPNALSACDPHQECIWEELGGADAIVLMISRAYWEDSVAWRMMTAARRCGSGPRGSLGHADRPYR